MKDLPTEVMRGWAEGQAFYDLVMREREAREASAPQPPTLWQRIKGWLRWWLVP